MSRKGFATQRSWCSCRFGDFPGGPVAKALCSQWRGPRFDPWSGNQRPHAATKSSQAAIRNPMCHSEDQRSLVLQLRPGAANQ